MEEFRKVFDTDRVVSGHEEGRRLTACHQGDRSVVDYSIEFRTLARETGWEEHSLAVLFAQGLSEEMKDELAAHELPLELDVLIDLALRKDSRHRERRRERRETTRGTFRLLPSPNSTYRFHDTTPQAGTHAIGGNDSLSRGEAASHEQRTLSVLSTLRPSLARLPGASRKWSSSLVTGGVIASWQPPSTQHDSRTCFPVVDIFEHSSTLGQQRASWTHFWPRSGVFPLPISLHTGPCDSP